MLVSELEKRLRIINPEFRVRYKHSVIGSLGKNIAGVFFGTKYICRIPQGEITLLGRLDAELIEKGLKDRNGKQITADNIRYIKLRGLRGLTALLRSAKLVNEEQICQILNPAIDK